MLSRRAQDSRKENKKGRKQRGLLLKEKKKRAATIAVKVIVTRPMSPMCYNTLLLDHVLYNTLLQATQYIRTHTQYIPNTFITTQYQHQHPIVCLRINSRTVVSRRFFFYCHYTCSTLFIIFFLRISRNLLK